MAGISTSTISSALTGSGSSGAFAVSGLVSGIDSKSVIDGLLAIEQQKITSIDKKKSQITAQQTAFKGVESRLLALQGQLTQFSRSQNSVFSSRLATSSNTDLVSAAASSSAVAGVYHLKVNSLARANQLASQGFESASSTITRGSFQLTVGDATTSITIDSTNDTLQGLASAINNSGAAVSAAVINDGSASGKQGHRLLLTAEGTGVANRIQISNQLASSTGGAVKPIFDASVIGGAIAATNNTSTAAALSNAGSGYTGTSNNVYTFKVVTGGAVGTDDGIQLSYTDASGANTGVITVNQGDADVLKTAAQGVGIQFAAGTLVTGDTFQVKAFVPTVQEAADASVTLGSGDGSLTISNATNQFDSLIPGVALQLQGSDPAKDITITVSNDTEKISTAIQSLVSAYNDAITYIDQQTQYNSTTQQGGPLLGNRQVILIESQIRNSVSNVVAGANPQLNHIGALGIKTDQDGKLVVDTSKLSNVLSGKVAGVTLDDVHKLFALSGSSTNPNVQFITGSTKTKASSTPYGIQISQAAEKATLTGSAPLAASTVIDSSNNEIQASVDGKTSSTLKIAVGTYTRAALAQAIQSAINGDSALAGRSISAGVVGNNLTLTSDRFGTASQITVLAGTALAALGVSAGAAAQGKDVVGHFIVNGETEPAVGTGQFLVGNASNANSADLQVRILLTPAQVGAGTTTDVSVARGIGSLLDQQLTSVFDPFNGRFKITDDGFNAQIDQLDQQKTDQNARIAAKRDQLTKQFAAMEQVLSQLQSAASYLTSQSLNSQSSSSSSK